MNKFKQSCLSLCLALMFCVGFLLTDSITAFAYSERDNIYNIDSNLDIWGVGPDDSTLYTGHIFPSEDGIYYLKNNKLTNVKNFRFYLEEPFSFPFNPDIYDYYLVGNMVALCDSEHLEDTTFKPTHLSIAYYDVPTQSTKEYNTSSLNIYDVDGTHYKGFGFYDKVDFGTADNIGFQHIILSRDKDGMGNKPANLQLQLGIMQVDKGSSESVVLSQILSRLEDMETSINSSISKSASDIINSIENQYNISDNEDFGVGDIQAQVEEKLGVLNFGADTLTNFLDLFSPANATNTVITFPAFSINVQGDVYNVWNDIEFNLAFLEENFGILINAVRTVTVLCVWLAVLGYLVKAKDELINNRG